MRTFLLILILLLFCATGWCTDYTALASCQGAWLYNEQTGVTVADASGHSMTMTFQGTGITWSTSTPNAAFGSKSLSYTGSGEIYATNTTWGFANFTVTTWVKKNANNAIHGIFCNGSDSSANCYRAYTNASGQVIYAAGTNVGAYYVSGSTISDITTYHHIAMTFDGTTLKGYFDGVPDGTSTTGTYTAANDYFEIGNVNYSYYYLNGYEGESANFNTALTSTQISDIHDHGLKGSALPATNTGAFFSFL